LIGSGLITNKALPETGRARDIIQANSRLVPKVGIEPTLPKEHEFESCASASSATSASLIYTCPASITKYGKGVKTEEDLDVFSN
jgi:hypothetical protein